MRVSSPTRVTVVGGLAGTLALAASVLMPSTAFAADPKAPGDFTGYGFDACVAPSQTVMDSWNLRSPYTAIGIYISGHSRYCGDKYQPNLSRSWVEKNASNGWRFIPIHVGYQSPCFKNNTSSRVQKKRMSSTISTARSQAASDAAETIAALKKYGFGSGSVSYLDLEWYSRTTSCDNAVLEFIDVWTEKLHSAGYKSGVYSSGSAGIAALDAAKKSGRSISYPDHVWLAWTNKKADTDGGPYLRDTVWANHQRIHQYHNGVNVTYGGHTINIDKNFLDVGKGSVATSDPKPCDVAMSFSSYPRLDGGDTGSRVSALQCLLKRTRILRERQRHVRLEHLEGDRRVPQVPRLGPDRDTPPTPPGRRCSRPAPSHACSSAGPSARRSGVCSGPSSPRARASRSTASTTARRKRRSGAIARRTA